MDEVGTLGRDGSLPQRHHQQLISSNSNSSPVYGCARSNAIHTIPTLREEGYPISREPYRLNLILHCHGDVGGRGLRYKPSS
jgi:hypothetical protein